jgi:hypothetical protein
MLVESSSDNHVVLREFFYVIQSLWQDYMDPQFSHNCFTYSCCLITPLCPGSHALSKSYSTCPVLAPPDTPEKLPSTPIRVAKKNKSHQQIKNVFIKNRGFPDQSDKFNILMYNIYGGPVLQKLKHPPPSLDVVNPIFSFRYDETLHCDSLCKNLDLSHLDSALQECIYALVK